MNTITALPARARSRPAVSASRGLYIAFSCCLILMPLWIVTMFGRSVWTPDEPREADISWRMSQQAERAIPSLAGARFLEKPPLTYWAAAAAQSLFPGHDAALRAPNLLYGVLALGAVVLLAFEMGGATAAWFAGLASASFLLSLQVASWLATDAALMAGVMLSLLGFYAGLNASESRAKLLWYLLMHGGLTLAFMAKGPAGWLVPISGAAGLIVFERQWRELRRWQLWIGVVIPFCVIGAWLIAVARSTDGAHALQVLLWSNVAGRVVTLPGTDAVSYASGHRNWPGKYLIQMPLYLAPWTFLFVAAIRRAWRAARNPFARSWRYALFSLGLPLLALSFAGTARGIYAAPLLPAAAVLIGLWAAERVFEPDPFDRRMMKATVWLVALLALVLFVTTGFIASADAAARSFAPIAATGAIVSMVALWFAFSNLRRQMWPRAIAATFGAFLLAFFATAVAVFPAMDGWQDLGALVRQVDHDLGGRMLAVYAADETIVAALDRELAGRQIARPDDIPAAQALFQSQNPPALLIKLSGVGAGPVLERLKSLGVKLRPPRETPALRDLTTQLGLAVEHVYELPQGRRYALLSPTPPVPD